MDRHREETGLSEYAPFVRGLQNTAMDLEKDARDLWNGTEEGEGASVCIEDAVRHIQEAIRALGGDPG